MIDVPQVLEDLLAIVAERGEDFVYEPPEEGAECVYREVDAAGRVRPSCIVGHVLDRHGLLDRKYAVDNVALHGVMVYGHAKVFLEDFTPEAVKVLGVAQEEQDNSQSWGYALRFAAQTAAALRESP